MNDYYSVRIDATPCNEDITDLAAAFLADAGFESFEPDSTGLTAYISARLGNGREIAQKALADFPFETEFAITSELVEGKDWNEEWEKHYFQPIVIDSRCVIHSSFHKDVPEAEYDIVIDPKELLEANWYRYDDLPLLPPPGTVARRLIEDTVAMCRAEYE